MAHPIVEKDTPMAETSKTFPIDSGIFTSAKVTVGGSTSANALAAIVSNAPFPAGNITVGQISVSVDTGSVTVKPTALPNGASVTFDVSGSARSGAGVYDKAADAIASLGLADPMPVQIKDGDGRRYVILDFGLSATATASATSPIGMLGSVTFGVNAKGDSAFAVLHQFDATQGAADALTDTFSSWRLPRNVAYSDGALNIEPTTWIIAELDGTLALNVAASLGWDVNFARNLTLLNVTQDLSVKIDASLKATLGLTIAGNYILVVGREDGSNKVRVSLSKQKQKGLSFGFNLNVGVQGGDPQLPASFSDFTQTLFGQQGQQVLSDVEQWINNPSDITQKVAGLTPDIISDLVHQVTGVDTSTALAEGQAIIQKALALWSSLPDKLNTMLWTYIGSTPAGPAADDFKAILGDLADPSTAVASLTTALQNTTFGDSPEGKFLGAIASQGLLALANDLPTVTLMAQKALDVINGTYLANLQSYINKKLDLSQVSDPAADLTKVEQWLQNRLATFLNKNQVVISDLQDIQNAIKVIDTKVDSWYKIGVQAITKQYNFSLAATYQSTTTDKALLDIYFDLSDGNAAALYNEVIVQSNLNDLLTKNISGVTLKQATLSHEIKRQADVQLNLPWYDFSSTSVTDAVTTLTVEESGGGLLMYQVSGDNNVTIQNRSSSQLSVLASLKAIAGQPPLLSATGSLAYDMRIVKAAMRPLDLIERTDTFITEYLSDLFPGGDGSVRTFYTDLDNAISSATRNSSNLLGDMAVSMQVTLPISALTAWFNPLSPSALKSAQMALSRSLQAAWRNLLSTLYFQDVSKYQPTSGVAALLLWSCFPVSTSVNDSTGTLQFNTDKQTYWDWADASLVNAFMTDRHTLTAFGQRLGTIKTLLNEAGSSEASFFTSAMVGSRISDAQTTIGIADLNSLLFTEAELISGATNALASLNQGLVAASNAPATAIDTLSQFAADLTETFNKKINSIYSGISDRVIGPMLLLQTTAGLGGSAATAPSAQLSLYALNPGHTADLTAFVTGINPPQAEVALAQILVSINQ
jgi:hypothetical protein